MINGVHFSFSNFNLRRYSMADYATLIRDIKDEIKAPHSPVIVFGGSYGGMLSTWMRLKYPSSVDGAVAGAF